MSDHSAMQILAGQWRVFQVLGPGGTVKQFIVVAIGDPTYKGPEFVMFKIAAEIRASSLVLPVVLVSVAAIASNMAVGSMRILPWTPDSIIVLGKV